MVTADTAKAAKNLFKQIDKCVASEVINKEPAPRPKSFIEKRWQVVNTVSNSYLTYTYNFQKKN
jgi:ribosomal protein S20